MARFLISFALMLAALLAIAWMTSSVVQRYIIDRGSVRWSVTLHNGVVSIHRSPRTRLGPVNRDRYDINTGIAPEDSPVQWWPQTSSVGTANRSVMIPLAPLLLLAVATSLGLPAYLMIKRRLRERAGRCLVCGHQRVSDAPCQECGTSVEGAKARMVIGLGRIVSRAAVMTVIAIAAIAVCVRAYVGLERRAVAADQARTFDYTWYLETCFPFETGSVVFATPGSGPTDLKAAIDSGVSTIVLLPGEHRAEGIELGDVRLIGAGRESTTLITSLKQSRRVAIENVTIQPPARDMFAQFHPGGSTLVLRDCAVRGYGDAINHAVMGTNTVLLVDRCDFDGTSTRRQAGRRSSAITIHGGRVYARESSFRNHRTDIEMEGGVVDACTLSSDTPTQHDLVRSSVQSFVRATTIPLPVGAGLVGPEFTQRLDDPDVLAQLARGVSPKRAWSDPLTIDMARSRGADNLNVFLPRFMLHPNPDIREIAKLKVSIPPLPFTPLPLDEALTKLDCVPMPREVVLGILDNEDAARLKLEAMKESGTPNERGNAVALLILMDVEPPLPDVVRATPLRSSS